MTLQLGDVVGTWVGSPPILYYQLQNKMEDPESSFEDFANIISSDTSLSARLLKIVNSPFYGYPSKIDTLSHALNIVGMNQLMDLTLAMVVTSKFKGIPRDLMNMESYWLHCIGTGITAKLISEYRGDRHVERIYVAGMLQDIGSLVLLQKFPENSKGVLQKVKEEKVPLHVVEKEMLGFDHAEVGGALLSGWKLPNGLVEVVKNHPYPLMAKDCMLEACILNFADAIAHELEIGNNGEVVPPVIEPKVLETVNLSEKALDEIKEKVVQNVDDAVSIFMD